MMSELILLTGGTGMVGFRTLIEALHCGYRVRAAVRNQAGVDKIKSHRLISPYQSQLDFIIVPDITVDGAYDEAVNGVTAILHVASAMPKPGITDFEGQIVTPAVKGTVGMLESAMKERMVRRIVITASIGSTIPAEKLATRDSAIYNEKSVCPFAPSSFSSPLAAYLGSKIIAFQAVTEFIEKEKPTFDVIRIFPGYIIGRNDLVTDVEHVLQGTNRLVLAQVLGQPSSASLPSTTAYLNDVAEAHVVSLSPSIAGNQNFVISSDGPHGATWGGAIEIVREHYSEDTVKEAGFKLDAARILTTRVLIDSTYSQKALGFQYKTYKEQVISIVDHYLELSKLKQT